jgi:hypothetical protein
MDSLAYFVPGQLPPAPARGIGAYLPAMPDGVAYAYVAALTQPGDLVLDPFCQTGRALRESVALGRRALGANLNPVAVRWIESQLWPPNVQAATTALVRLGDSPRGDTTLREHMMSLYATRCPTCNKNAVAESFVWERDADEPAPTAKRVRCSACKTESAGPADDADVTAARRFESRGMAYWFTLERAAPDEPDERERAAMVVEAYTARTLLALADLLRKYDAASAADQAALAPILLSAFEAALVLHSAEEERPRPRSLKIPARFIERNLWLAIEDALQPLAAPAPPTLPRSPDIATLAARQDATACLVAQSARGLGKLVPPGSTSLIVAVPPQPDPTFWALSAVWTAWLWNPKVHGAAQSQIAESVRLLLARRRADMDWWWRGMAQALGSVVPVLAENGHIVLVSSDADEDILTGLLLAGAGAGLAIEHALVEPQQGLRVMWRKASAASRELDAEALAIEVGEAARHAASEILRERGEPTRWLFVHAAIQAALAQAGLTRIAARMPEGGPQPLDLVQQATLDGLQAATAHSPVYPVEDWRGLWWLTDPSQAAPPLKDRVEAAVYELLMQCEAESEIVAEVYHRFPGALTPERAYIRLCLESYAAELRPGVWKLREEDTPTTRHAEIASLRAELIALGPRLGCEAVEREGRVMWAEARHPLFTFTFSATAELGAHLLKRPPHGQPVLVLPGGRGALAHHKLRHDARLREAAQGGGWMFLKFRQLRNLVGQAGLDRASFTSALGLDPLIEKEGQMALL